MPLSTDFESMFDLSPVALWLEDYSGLKQLFDRWRSEGVVVLVAHLIAVPQGLLECIARLRVLRVNQQALTLFAARSQDELVSQLDRIFSSDMAAPVIQELNQLWQGQLHFDNQTVNYALDGRRLDVRVRARILPGHEASWDRVLVSLDDVTERVRAERKLLESERYARDLFGHSPVSLWVEDFSSVKRLLDEIRQRGIQDFATFIKVHPEFVTRCMHEIRVIDVNRETLRMFGAPDKETLLRNIARVFRDEMRE
ncbi:MAG: diguanylate cyclase, partial [Variovorax sp.]|nr:diguanylate cyclase [Variovorax sp.]